MTDPLAYIKAKRASLHDLDDEDVDLLVREVERLRDLLGRLEWAGRPRPRCPACDGRPTSVPGGLGHGPPCWLAAELQRRDPPGSPPSPEGEASPDYEQMWEDCRQHRDQAERRARRYMDIVRQVAELVAPDEEE